jgi:4'-phosphopantetheinyl transferase
MRADPTPGERVDALADSGNPVAGADAPAALPSPAPGIALWWCGLARSPAELAALAATLAPAEHARAARFGTTALRERYVAGRGLLRRLLGERLGLDPAAVPLRRGLRGRPELAFADAPDFNVSHTDGVALIAIADRPRIGVDIERRDRTVASDQLARKFLTERERAGLAPLADDERRQRFLRLWTCKEAMSKATGDGLAAPFRQIDVDLASGATVVAGPPPYLPGAWTVHFAAVPPGYFATVAIWRNDAVPRPE